MWKQTCGGDEVPETMSHPSGSAKWVSIGPCGVTSGGIAELSALSPSLWSWIETTIC